MNVISMAGFAAHAPLATYHSVIQDQCGLNNAVAPLVDKIAGNVKGVAPLLITASVIILIVVGIAVAHSSHLSKIMKGLLIVVGLGMLLGIATGFVGVFVTSNCPT